MKGMDNRYRRLASAISLLILSGIVVPAPAQEIRYAAITSAPPVTSASYVDIHDDLTIILPAKGSKICALVTLDVPQPYAKGVDFPAVGFGIFVEDLPAGNPQLVADGGFSYTLKVPPSFGRMPTTIVAKIKLKAGIQQKVRARWRSVRNSTGVIDSFASLSGITGTACP